MFILALLAACVPAAPMSPAGLEPRQRLSPPPDGDGALIHEDPLVISSYSGSSTGAQVAGDMDLDGDGYDDVAIGTDGAVAVHLGGASGISTSADLLLRGDYLDDTSGTGYRVAGGDLNGDGYDDLAVGVYQYAGLGRVYILHGGAGGLSASSLEGADSAIDGIGDGENGPTFGLDLSAGGDINDDGYADLVVAAPDEYPSYGAVHIFLGAATGVTAAVSSDADATLKGSNWVCDCESEHQTLFGYSVDIVGDVNGDGYDDVLVGDPEAERDHGQVYLYLGSASGIAGRSYADTSADAKIPSLEDDNFGESVSGAGDVNGDGYDDVIVGAPDGGTAGMAYLFYGSAGGLSAADTDMADATLSGVEGSFGAWVSSADVDADGYSDVLVGDPDGDEGHVTVFRGSARGVSSADADEADLIIEGGGGDFGAAVEPAGDVNGDGDEDLLAGAPDWSSGAGQAYAFYSPGDARPDNAADADITLQGGAPMDELGSCVGPAGDVNADGFDDMLVAHEDGALLFLGSETGVAGSAAEADARLASTSGGASNVVATAGDINADGFHDVLLGCQDRATEAVCIFMGASLGLASTGDAITEADATITAETDDTDFGDAVGSAGDLNGDGFDDVVIGDPGYDLGLGRAYVFYGAGGGISASVAADADATYTGGTTSALGKSVASAGDLNGDGYADLVLGGPFAAYPVGQAWIYYGAAAGLVSRARPDLTISGDSTARAFGAQVGAAGDVNADGFDDLVVLTSDAGGVSSAVQLFYGAPGGLTATTAAEADVTVAAGEDVALGWIGRTAGDVNADGYADLIAGNSIVKPEWNAYIFQGSPSGILASSVADADAALSGDLGVEWLQVTGGWAGDVNGDGGTDLAMGLHSAQPGGSVEVYLGACEATTWYADADGDGFGDEDGAVSRCTPRPGEVSDATDCDDADSGTWPGAAEVAGDGVDQDCNGEDLAVDADDSGVDDSGTDDSGAGDSGDDETEGKDGGTGCTGCAAGAPPGSGLLALTTLLLALRRRRRAD